MSVADVLVLVTHAFALPAIVRARSVALKVQIVVAVGVSLAFHALDNAGDAQPTKTLQRLDHATSTALIATVLLQKVARIQNLTSFLVLVSGLAAAFLVAGNMIGVGVTALVFFLSLLPATTFSQGIISVFTLGGKATSSVEWNGYLTAALLFQILSVIAYGVGEWAPVSQDGWTRGWHSGWHALAFLALFALVEYTRNDGAVAFKRNPRAEYRAFPVG